MNMRGLDTRCSARPCSVGPALARSCSRLDAVSSSKPVDSVSSDGVPSLGLFHAGEVTPPLLSEA